MTASAAALAALAVPFAVLGTRPGLEILQPMALVILGGVVSSTLMALFVDARPLPAPGTGRSLRRLRDGRRAPNYVFQSSDDHENGYPPRRPALGQGDRLMSGARTGGSSARAVGLLAGVLSAGLLLAGCKEVEEASAPVHEPATVEEVAGLDVKRVTFDQAGADRVSLRTATVRKTCSRNRGAVRRADL